MSKIIWLTTCLLVSITSLGQEVVSTSSGQATGNQGSISYVVGQVNGSPFSAQVSPGVLQPYKVSIILSAEGSIEVNVYPNPTVEQLFIEGKFIDGDYSYMLYNMSGQSLKQGKLEVDKEPLNLTEFVSDTYFVSIMKGSELIKTFRIVKSH